jgi:hypothetical protein
MENVILAFIVTTGCGDEHKDLFTPPLECKGDPIVPFAGAYPHSD